MESALNDQYLTAVYYTFREVVSALIIGLCILLLMISLYSY